MWHLDKQVNEQTLNQRESAHMCDHQRQGVGEEGEFDEDGQKVRTFSYKISKYSG